MQPTPRTPGFVIVAAVLLFVYGGLMLVCSFCGIWQAVSLFQGDAGPLELFAQDQELAKRIPSYMAIESGISIFNLLLGGCMILAGAGAGRLKPFARRLGTATAAVDLFLTLGHFLYNVIVVLPVNEQILAEQAQNMPGNMANFAQGLSVVGLVFGTIVTLAFGFLIILFLNVKKSRDAFAGIFEPTPEEERMAQFEALAEDGYFGRRPPRRPETGETGIQGKPD